MLIHIKHAKKLALLILALKFLCIMFQIFKLNIWGSKKKKKAIIHLDGLDMLHNLVHMYVELKVDIKL